KRKAAAVAEPAPKIGPVSRSQMSPKRPSTTSTFATSAKRARASASASSLPTISRTRSRPGPARARTSASTSAWAGARFSSHSSSWLGQPTHMARWGAHSAGTGRIMGPLPRTTDGPRQIGVWDLDFNAASPPNEKRRPVARPPPLRRWCSEGSELVADAELHLPDRLGAERRGAPGVEPGVGVEVVAAPRRGDVVRGVGEPDLLDHAPLVVEQVAQVLDVHIALETRTAREEGRQ